MERKRAGNVPDVEMTERGQVGETKRLNILYSVALHINRVQIIQSLEKVRTDSGNSGFN